MSVYSYCDLQNLKYQLRGGYPQDAEKDSYFLLFLNITHTLKSVQENFGSMTVKQYQYFIWDFSLEGTNSKKTKS